MTLVDYSSDSDSSAESARAPPAKRRKPSPAPDSTRPAKPALPPLPSAFHDLYASTVRQSVVDDPSLHQGRRRVNPHVPGNWPSHVYVEWHPSQDEHDALVSLVHNAEKQLGAGQRLASLLTSDLGAPLPLHISLSRPLALTTEKKDDFLGRVSAGITGYKVSPFSVKPTALHFFKSPDSNRTFLVLKVHPPAPTSRSAGETSHPNPLSTLLSKCNAVAETFSLPLLYSHRSGVDDGAFHVSLAWTLDTISEDERSHTERLLNDAGVRNWEIHVDGVKVKIGNVVTHVPLGVSLESKSLFA